MKRRHGSLLLGALVATSGASSYAQFGVARSDPWRRLRATVRYTIVGGKVVYEAP